MKIILAYAGSFVQLKLNSGQAIGKKYSIYLFLIVNIVLSVEHEKIIHFLTSESTGTIFPRMTTDSGLALIFKNDLFTAG